MLKTCVKFLPLSWHQILPLDTHVLEWCPISALNSSTKWVVYHPYLFTRDAWFVVGIVYDEILMVGNPRCTLPHINLDIEIETVFFYSFTSMTAFRLAMFCPIF